MHTAGKNGEDGDGEEDGDGDVLGHAGARDGLHAAPPPHGSSA